MTRAERRRTLTGLLFISPAIVGFFAFVAFPIVASFYYSLTRYDVLSPPQWVGLANYRFLLTKDETFRRGIYNTLYMVVIGLPLHLLFDFLVALLLNQKIRGIALYRTIFYIPSITPAVVSAVLWLWIFNGQYGLLNAALNLVGLPGQGWLTTPALTKPALIFMGAWYGGNTIIILLAGLQDVPQELYEAAEIDGAGAFAKTIYVTLPMISSVIFYTLIIGMIGYFQFFTEAWVLTANRSGDAGGPAESLMFYTIYLYQNAFIFFKMGYASAMAWILFAIILAATVLLFRTSGWVYYRGKN
jgi:multiple sugar transport system permease protein